ncbi:MAG: NACHT domain-containing protein [Pirellulaceae bacterium]|nr:NACHT domain-containing protein [Pirellulaceae bacterium]
MDDSKDRRQSAKSFEKELKTYNEWFRLADSTTSFDKFSAHELPKYSNRCVVIGGPGSGKSTLCKRIAYDAAEKGAIVALVGLKRLQQQMAQGATFETAILNEATDGFDLSQSEREWLGRNIDILIADGLDECDPERQDVSNRLRKWLEGHANTRVLATTRPVGHHPSLLAGFDSFELLPLDELAIKTHSLKLFEKAMDKEELPATRWSQFVDDVTSDKSSGKSMASRNPLLLGFLVRLSVDGLEIGKNRVALYGQIFGLMSKTTSSNPPGRPNITPEHANLSIDLAAFLMIKHPMIQLDELVAAASKLKGSSHDPREFRASLTFWENTRAIERITAGHLNAIVFVHPALGEFSAARYICTLDSREFQTWFVESRRKPNWRQSILLACQIDDNRLISQLIEHDDVDDPCSIEAVIAAEALAESTVQPTTIIESVTKALAARLKSSNPFICLEAAQAQFQIAHHIQGEAFFLSEELLNHEHEWTRLGALALTVRSSHFDDHVELFERWLQEFKYSSGFSLGKWTKEHDRSMPEQAGELQHQVIEVGVPKLLKYRNRDEIEDYFRNGRDFADVSGTMLSAITEALSKAGFKELAQELHQRVRETPFDTNLFENTNSDPALIEAITLAARFDKVEPIEGSVDDLQLIKAIVKSLRMGEFPARDGYYLKKRIHFDNVVEVIKGVIGCLSLDLSELKNEIAIANFNLENSSNLHSLYSRSSPRDANWNLAPDIGLDAKLLGEALEYPHGAVAYGAALLLEGGAAGDKLESILEATLANGSWKAVRFASFLSEDHYGGRSKEVALERLRSEIRPGYEYLVAMLLKNGATDEWDLLREDIPRWLVHEDPYFVSHVAECLAKHGENIPEYVAEVLSAIFNFWTEKGTWCRKHKIPTQGDSCPECNLVLPCPRESLLRLLFQAKLISSSELLPYLNDKQSDVTRVAKELFLQDAARNPALVGEALEQILVDGVPISFLHELSELSSDILSRSKCHFEKLLVSENGTFRRAALNNLGSTWLPRDEAVVWAKRFLDATSPTERVAATKVLRLLENS